MPSHPEHELQVMVNKAVRAHVPHPHFFCGIDRSKKASTFSHVREKARGFVAGTPDTILLIPGQPLIAIELKAPGNKPTEAQFRVGQAINAAGGVWGWCDTVIGYLTLLRSLGVQLQGSWEIAAAGHDATLEGAAIKRRESGGITVRSYKPQEAKPTAAKLRTVARIRAAGIRI